MTGQIFHRWMKSNTNGFAANRCATLTLSPSLLLKTCEKKYLIFISNGFKNAVEIVLCQ